MEKTSERKIWKFFGAANSYSGFKSFFDRIFTPEDFEKIYVIKGGPGTGKSSFMRKLADAFFTLGYEIEHIYCSSDPNSLDGVIIKSKSKKIALLDGTAPHERDAKIPGAFDEIINLGESIDKRILSPQKKNILELQKEKQEAYKTAYFYLSSAGKSQEIIHKVYKENFDVFGANNKAEAFLCELLPSKTHNITNRLISSFGRNGNEVLNTLEGYSGEVISVGGDDYSNTMFLDCCFDILMRKQISSIRLLQCLDTDRTDALILPDRNLAIVRDGVGKIDANEFLNIKHIDKEKIKTATYIHNIALDEAKRWFSIASDIHFRLEKIYGDAMDFENNNKILTEKQEEIAELLEKDL